MKLHFVNLNNELLSAVAELEDIAGFQLAEDGLQVMTEPCEQGLSVIYSEHGVTLRFSQRVELFRAIGRLVETAADQTDVYEIPAYEDLCVMYDVARNAVFTVDMTKRVIRHLALMGYNSLQLYVEDCYEVDGYPYFGYMRGRYTKTELKQMAAYGDRFGVELVPCIQVLAHLNQAVRWSAHSEMHDCDAILLVDEPKTYELIDAMFCTLEECFTSRRVNVGMDEAWSLGFGKYFKKHGYVERWKILNSHLQKVMEISKRHGFSPMMWSDMYFSAAFDHQSYYYATTLDDPHIPQNVIDSAPDGMELIYWDYGNFYKDVNIMAGLHKEFRNNPIWFAGGATKWVGYAPMNEFSIWCSRDQLRAIRENGIRKVMVTVWSSSGGWCANMSILPTLQMYAEDCYANNTDETWLSQRFATCADGNFQDFMTLDCPNQVPGNPSPGGWWCTPCTFLMHQDVMLGLFDKHVVPGELPPHFEYCSTQLREAGKRNPRWSYMFDTLAALCDTLVLKSEVGANLIAAYKAGECSVLADTADRILPEILNRLNRFINIYRTQWLTENKIFGLDVVEIRLGALKFRTETAILRLKSYLSGEVDSLPELEEERLYYDNREREHPDVIVEASKWANIVSACPLDSI